MNINRREFFGSFAALCAAAVLPAAASPSLRGRVRIASAYDIYRDVTYVRADTTNGAEQYSISLELSGSDESERLQAIEYMRGLIERDVNASRGSCAAFYAPAAWGGNVKFEVA